MFSSKLSFTESNSEEEYKFCESESNSVEVKSLDFGDINTNQTKENIITNAIDSIKNYDDEDWNIIKTRPSISKLSSQKLDKRKKRIKKMFSKQNSVINFNCDQKENFYIDLDENDEVEQKPLKSLLL